MSKNKLKLKHITDNGPGYAVFEGNIYRWNEGYPRYIKTESGDDMLVPDYGRGWYIMCEDTIENRKHYGIPVQ